MTTPNIEELRKLAESAKPKPIGNMASQQEKSAHMTRHMDARMALARAMEPEHVITMCDFMQSQAERIKVIERESEMRRIELHDVMLESDQLRAELAAIAATEPSMIYHGRCIIDCGDSGHQDVTMLKMIARETKLFTHPMPAQDVTELVDALEKLARLGNGEHYGNSDGNMIARNALYKYKGAK